MRLLIVALALLLWNCAEAADAPHNFQQHCASCHGPDRLGGSGPALLILAPDKIMYVSIRF